MTNLFFWAGAGLIALALFMSGYWAAMIEPLPRPGLGISGYKRHQALSITDSSFRCVEPVMRYIGRHVEMWCPMAWRQCREEAVQAKLTQAGAVLGLSGTEFLALQCIGGVVMATFAILAVNLGDLPLSYIAMGAALGVYLPWVQLNEEIKKRHKRIDRGLPHAIDLASMCMSAGMDFVGSLRQVLAQAPEDGSPIHEELHLVLQDLELGQTRKQALLHFVDRASTDTIKDFVSSVIQSEEKGTPLAQVLRIQATMLRMRRSVAAEEAAARAGVMMMLPLMMLMASVMLIIIGPLFIETMQKGF